MVCRQTDETQRNGGRGGRACPNLTARDKRCERQLSKHALPSSFGDARLYDKLLGRSCLAFPLHERWMPHLEKLWQLSVNRPCHRSDNPSRLKDRLHSRPLPGRRLVRDCGHSGRYKVRGLTFLTTSAAQPLLNHQALAEFTCAHQQSRTWRLVAVGPGQWSLSAVRFSSAANRWFPVPDEPSAPWVMILKIGPTGNICLTSPRAAATWTSGSGVLWLNRATAAGLRGLTAVPPT